jgi:hypothetical protein
MSSLDSHLSPVDSILQRGNCIRHSCILYLPPSIIQGIIPDDLSVPNFHIIPAGTITPAVCKNDSIDDFEVSNMAAGNLRKILMGCKLFSPIDMALEDNGSVEDLHSLKDRATIRTV